MFCLLAGYFFYTWPNNLTKNIDEKVNQTTFIDRSTDFGDILPASAPSLSSGTIIYLDSNGVVQIQLGEGVTMSEAAKQFFEYLNSEDTNILNNK